MTDVPRANTLPSGGPQDPETLAGEYVLGTLSFARRQQVEARLDTDAVLREAVARWEARLLPLTTLAEPVEPAPALWGRILHSVENQGAQAARTLAIAAYEAAAAQAQASPAPHAAAGRPPQPGSAHGSRRRNNERQPLWSQLWHSMSLWRGLAGTGFAAAAVLAAVLLSSGGLTPAAPGYLVVLVAPSNQAAGWIVQARSAGQLELQPVGVGAEAALPAGKALQFWTKADGWTKPVSLGLVTPGQAIRVPLDQLPPLQANQLFELTIEPAGGSPTNLPTGPIQFIGRAVKVAT